MRKPLITLLFWSVLCTPAFAQTRHDVLALQTRMNQDGFYTGELDGQSGPTTRAALAAAAQTFGTAADLSSVYLHYYKRSLGADRSTATPYQIEQARTAISQNLRDAESSRFRNEHAFKTEKSLVVCGEINGKNLYGAYVGFQPYAVTYSIVSFALPGTPKGEPNIMQLAADLEDYTGSMCDMGTSLGAAILNRPKP